MGETRVNLKHLLEDIRDSYPFPQEEAIVTEFIANALDSGASEISFTIHTTRAIFTITDNGAGMAARVLEEYHDIATTTKVRGKGIGFAGVGAKLALLVAEAVATETVSKGSHKATLWRLESPTHAPWEYIPSPGLLKSSHGTAISLKLRERNSALASPEFVERVIQTHFYPILDREFMEKMLRKVYKNGVAFTINGKPVRVPADERREAMPFWIQTGKRGKPIGIGYLSKSDEALPEEKRGIAISTYGKVIKRGWDWTGIAPRNPTQISGVIEMPHLSEILTLNKADFLKDAASLKKYYRYRKAIQDAVEPILRQLDEISEAHERSEKNLRPLEKEIELVLSNLEMDFPELSPLLVRPRRSAIPTGSLLDPNVTPISSFFDGFEPVAGPASPGGREEGAPMMDDRLGEARPGEYRPVENLQFGLSPENVQSGDPAVAAETRPEAHVRMPDIMIGFEDNSDREEIAWMVDNTVWINRSHPAYRRVMDTEAETYHIVLAVCWVLSRHLQDERSPQMFINRFLSNWGSRV